MAGPAIAAEAPAPVQEAAQPVATTAEVQAPPIQNAGQAEIQEVDKALQKAAKENPTGLSARRGLEEIAKGVTEVSNQGRFEVSFKFPSINQRSQELQKSSEPTDQITGISLEIMTLQYAFGAVDRQAARDPRITKVQLDIYKNDLIKKINELEVKRKRLGYKAEDEGSIESVMKKLATLEEKDEAEKNPLSILEKRMNEASTDKNKRESLFVALGLEGDVRSLAEKIMNGTANDNDRATFEKATSKTIKAGMGVSAIFLIMAWIGAKRNQGQQATG